MKIQKKIKERERSILCNVKTTITKHTSIFIIIIIIKYKLRI